MPDCPTSPPIPEEVKQRFRSMKDWDALHRRMVADLCDQIPDQDEIDALQARVADLEEAVETMTTTIEELREEITEIKNECCDDGSYYFYYYYSVP